MAHNDIIYLFIYMWFVYWRWQQLTIHSVKW